MAGGAEELCITEKWVRDKINLHVDSLGKDGMGVWLVMIHIYFRYSPITDLTRVVPPQDNSSG